VTDDVPVTADSPANRERRERLRRLLGTEELAWLRDRVRRRLEFGQDLTGTVTHPAATDAERAAAARLLGRPLRTARSLSVPLPAVDRVLRDSGASPDGLAAAVVELTGPVIPRSDAEQARDRAWRDAFAPLEAAVLSHPDEALRSWLAELRARGLVARLSGGRPEVAAVLLADLARTVSALPGGEESLSAFAARVLGDAHALDDDRPLATLALGAARVIAGTGPGSGAQWRRETWAAVGLLKDDLSSQVLTLGLPGDTVTATGRALAALREAGEPAVLTLRQLVRVPPRPSPLGTAVFVCENPAVVSAAADQLGPHCPPLVCTTGQPSAAAITLLRLLADAGAEPRYHGDFDWGGLRIASGLRSRVAWRPWRFDATAYLAALERHPDTAPLSAPPASIETPWDPGLRAAMARARRRVEEELVLADLLADLADLATRVVTPPLTPF
jgi:uncharacterized protein (TIGR02679 family)